MIAEADLLANPVSYAENLLWLRDKRARIVPFKLNPTQRRIRQLKAKALDEGRKARFIILKPRRTGVTTLEQAENFWTVAANRNTQVVTLAQEAEATEKIFRISQLFYDRLHKDYKPRKLTEHNKRELNFPGLNSLFYIGTAGKRGFGRGDTLNRVHCSEVAWWPGKQEEHEGLLAGLTEACSHGEVVLESTACGIGGLYHGLWTDAVDGKNDWVPLFLPWWEDPENALLLHNEEERVEIDDTLTESEIVLIQKHGLTAEQIKWRRDKQRTLKALFPQEYPEDDVTCFLVSGTHFFDLTIVRELVPHCDEPIEKRDNDSIRIWKKPEKGHEYVAGADTAEGTEHGDFAGLGILDRRTCEQVADFHARCRPEVLAKKSVELCREYNTAVLAIEANNHGHSALNTAKNTLHYPRLFMHKSYDAKGTKKLGWQTNDKTRPIMLDDLKVAIEDRLMKVNDKQFLAELFTFQDVSESDAAKARYGARSGKHDDRIIKWGIAWAVRQIPANAGRLTWI